MKLCANLMTMLSISWWSHHLTPIPPNRWCPVIGKGNPSKCSMSGKSKFGGSPKFTSLGDSYVPSGWLAWGGCKGCKPYRFQILFDKLWRTIHWWRLLLIIHQLSFKHQWNIDYPSSININSSNKIINCLIAWWTIIAFLPGTQFTKINGTGRWDFPSWNDAFFAGGIC